MGLYAMHKSIWGHKGNRHTVMCCSFIGLLNPRITIFKTASLTVVWDPASSPYCGGVLYYQVVITDGEKPLIYVTTAELSVPFSDLMGNRAYNISVVAVNRAGNGITGVTNFVIAGT